MNLKEFVAETLSQIVEGVKDAQARVKEHGAIVNPALYGIAGDFAKLGLFTAGEGTAQMVQFDVALTAMEGTGTKGGVGVMIAAFTLGSTGESQTENSSVSRVKFSVPLVLPDGAHQK